ncbi:hypothetical protein NDI56_16795 [Haloarcula sp. S1CR25-12]|uniref:Uncharacterized protein n=1 Tax=Haloarcula saliterrae TaxID=2950534 RepID=A0ABU2FFM2_9EURY|nr:hypothetical protein [Haloarcula sp. S1CR25-12]MDS0261058.1 hypothetical protein [Haloarcula sp. S1CR25-12]
MGLFDGVKDKVEGLNQKRKEVEEESALQMELKLQKWVLNVEDCLVAAIYYPPEGGEPGFFQYYVKSDGSAELTDELLDSDYVEDIEPTRSLGPEYEVLTVNLTREGDNIAADWGQFDEPVFGPDDRFEAMYVAIENEFSKYVDQLIEEPGVGYIRPLTEEESENPLQVFLLEDRMDVDNPTEVLLAPYLIDIEITAAEQQAVLAIELLLDPLVDSVVSSDLGAYEREDQSERLELHRRLDGL